MRPSHAFHKAVVAAGIACSLFDTSTAALVANISDANGILNVSVTITSPPQHTFLNVGNPRSITDPVTYTDTMLDTPDYDLYAWDDLGNWFPFNQAFLIDGFGGVSSSTPLYGVFFDDDGGDSSDDFGIAVPTGTFISGGTSFSLTAPLPAAGFTAVFTPGTYSAGQATLVIETVPEPEPLMLYVAGAGFLALRRRRPGEQKCRIGSRGVISSPVPHHPAYGSVQGGSDQTRALGP